MYVWPFIGEADLSLISMNLSTNILSSECDSHLIGYTDMRSVNVSLIMLEVSDFSQCKNEMLHELMDG